MTTQFTLVEEEKPETDSGLFNPRNLIQMLRRRAWPVAITVSAIIFLAALGYWLAPKEYQATGSVALDRRPDELVDVKSEQKPLTTDSSSVETEVQVIKSPAVAAAVVQGLGLDRMQDFGIGSSGPTTPEAARDRAIRVVQSGLVATRAGTSYAINVQYEAPDPVLAARIVNAAINSYTGGQRSSQARQLNQDIAMLADRINAVRADVLRTETTVAQYRAQTGLIDLAANSDAANQSMQQLNTQLAQARADEAAAAAKSSSGASIADATSSGALSSLRSKQAELSAQIAQLTQRYSDDYPAVVSAKEQLGAVNSALAAEQSRIRQGVAAEAAVARNRASSLRGSVDQQQSQLMHANAASVRLAELERNSDAAKTLYASLLDQYKQKLASQGTEQSKAYVVAYAAPPNVPSSPNLLAYLIGGIVAALLGGALVATTLENMEGGLLNQSMTEKALGLPVLAAVPDVRTVKDAPLKGATPGDIADHLLRHPTGVFAESLRSVRTGLNLGQEGQSKKIFAVTSAVADEGKTTTAVCLARSAAAAGSRVLLIDCDLRRHAASSIFAPSPSAGLYEVLRNEARIERAIVKDPATGMDFLPATASAHPSIDVITSRAMRTLLRRVSESYDLVLLEMPPVLPVAETRVVSAMADGTILVVRWRKTPVEVARKAIGLLTRAHANLAGTVLTRVSLSWTAVGSLGDDVYYYQSYAAEAA
jgi:polysaccharide biosynthesis transport protein